MQRGRPSLDVVLHDESSGVRMSLSLLHVDQEQASLVGVLLAPELGVPITTRLDVAADAAAVSTAFGDEGSFTVESDGEIEEFSYFLSVQNTREPYRLVEAQVNSRVTESSYIVFAIDDPVPLVVIAPIAGAVAGITWLWRRHRRRDQIAGDVIGDAVKQALDEGRSVDLHQESDSTVTFSVGVSVHAKSTFDIHIGERPAA